MSRPQKIEDQQLMKIISDAFRDKGYSGVSIADLAERSGLKKASLYHRFPGGKAQMAEEAMHQSIAWFEENVVAVLQTEHPFETRIKEMNANLSVFYNMGRSGCLLNKLGDAGANNELANLTNAAMTMWSEALADAMVDQGIPKNEAISRGRLAIALIEGSLVVSKGLNENSVFKDVLKHIEFLASSHDQ